MATTDDTGTTFHESGSPEAILAEREAEIERLKSALFERNKELRVQHKISKIIGNPVLTPDDILHQIAGAIPDAFQFPESTGACITVGPKVYESSLFTRGTALLEHEIELNGENFGTVEISCNAATAPGTTPFLPDEIDLIGNIALRLGILLGRYRLAAEQQKVEALHQSVLNASPDLITITDFQGRIVFSSQRTSQMFGYDDIASITGRNLLDFLDPSCHEKAMTEIGKMAQGQLSGAEEYIGIKADGTRFEIEVNGEYIRNDDGVAVQMMFVTRDISDRKKAEKKLADTEERFRKLIENLNDVVYEVTNDGGINYVSPSIEQFLGYKPEELIGKNFFTYMFEEDRPAIMQRLSQLERRDYDFLEYRYYSKSGDVKWVRSSTTPVIADGKLVGGRGVLIDITERKNAELLIKRSEEKYRALFNDAPDGYLILRNGVYTECNTASETMIGGTRNDIIGKSPCDLSPEYQPNGKRSADYQEEIVKVTFASGKKCIEWMHSRLDGTEFLALVNLSAISYEEVPVLLVTWRDITAVREAEALLRKLSTAVDQSPVSIVITDTLGNIEYANPMASRTTGYDLEELKGKNPRVLKSGETGDKAYSELWNTITSGKTWRGTFHNRKKTGELYWENSVISPIVNADGKITHFVAVKEDVTEMKETEYRLRKSEEKYRLIFETINDVYYEASLSGEILEISPSVYALTRGQYTREDLLGTSLYDYYQSAEERTVFIGILMKKGRVDDYEVALRNRDGSVIPISLSSSILFDRDGNPLKIAGSVRDITERKRAYEEIRKFRIIADKATYGVAIAQPDGTILYVNPFWARTHGWEIEETIGKNLTMFHSGTQLDQVADAIKLLVQKGEFDALEIGHTRKDGSVFPALMSAVVVTQDDKPLYMSATVIDISEIKEKEREIRRLNLAIEQSPVSIVHTDLQANILYVSPAFTKITGYRASEVIGRNVRIMKSGKTPVSVYQDLWQTLQSGHSWQGEWINRKRDGSLYWESISITPVLDENSQITSYLAIKEDISERKKAEEEIRKLNATLEQKVIERTAELEETNTNLLKEIEERKKIEEALSAKTKEADQSNQAKSEFLSRMSHELRTPMNSILGFAQLLERGDLNPGQKKGVGHIMRSGKHLLQLINEVLDISRIEAGRITLSLELVKLSGIIHEMVDIVQPSAANRQVSIVVEETEANNCFVKSDRQKLKQVLLNLLSNAIKYNKLGGVVRIRTDVMPVREDGHVPVRVSVTDTGIGISEEDLPKLFVPFERIGAEKSETEGTGLGLAVVKNLVNVMGGNLGVTSVAGEGSTFWIEFPQTENQLENIQKLIVDGKVVPKDSSRKGLILYVEDNISNIELVQEILDTSLPGIRLVTTMYGKEAVNLAIVHKPGLILLDLDLPDIHGSEVLKLLLADERTSRIPVVILSSDAMKKHFDTLLKVGAREYMTKPIDVDNFLKMIDTYFAIK